MGSVGSLSDPFVLPGSDSNNNQWGLYTFNVLPTSGSGRLAFRYFATDGGVNGTQAKYAAIDTVSYTAAPEPSFVAGTLMIGGLGTAHRLRNKGEKVKA